MDACEIDSKRLVCAYVFVNAFVCMFVPHPMTFEITFCRVRLHSALVDPSRQFLNLKGHVTDPGLEGLCPRWRNDTKKLMEGRDSLD